MIPVRCALVVDDARFMREVLREAVAPLAEIVLEAATPAEARDLARDRQPGFVTMDLTLDAEETVQGLAAIAAVREAAPGAPVVVVSALDQPWVRREVACRGARAFVHKPFDADGLRETIRALLEENA